MQVGEFFVKIGLIGGKQTADGLQKTEKGMSLLVDRSFALKAQLLGAAYAFTKMVGASGERGAELQTFARNTGLSTIMLQKWQQAGRNFGLANEEVTSSIEAVQDAMTEMMYSGRAPEAFSALENAVGFDREKAKDTFYVMDKIQEYVKKIGDPALRNKLAQSFGVSKNLIGVMANVKGKISDIKPINLISEGEQSRLMKMNVAITELGTKWQIGLSRIFAKNGGGLVKDVTKLSDAILKMSSAVTDLLASTGAIELMSKAIDGWAMGIKLLADYLGYKNTDQAKNEVRFYEKKRLFDMSPEKLRGLSFEDYEKLEHFKGRKALDSRYQPAIPLESIMMTQRGKELARDITINNTINTQSTDAKSIVDQQNRTTRSALEKVGK